MGHLNGVYVPDHVVRQQQDLRARHEAELFALAQLNGVCQEWTKILKEIDDRLEMVWFDDHAKAAGVTPGRFHVLRHNPAARPGLHPVTGPNGEFIFPNSALLDKLRAADLWDDRVVADRKKREKALEDAEQRQKDREREERVEEFNERLKAIESPGVSMTGQGKGWRFRA